MKIMDKTRCMGGLEMPKMGFKYKAKLISKMRKLANIGRWGAPHQERDSREFNLPVQLLLLP